MRSKIVHTSTYYLGHWRNKETSIVGEAAVTLTVNGEAWLTFMCTPNDLCELALGFLYNEEIIAGLDDVASVRVCPTNDNVDVWLNRSVQKPEKWTRTSGCSGGKTSLVGDRQHHHKMDKPHNGKLLPAQKIGEFMEALGKAQDLYKESGGVHTSALCNGERILLAVEDIGRHNTLDKLAGHCLALRLDTTKTILLTTGRISSEMMQKAVRMKVAFVISRTSPSSLSVQIAQDSGITLIGYARRDRFTVYTHQGSILLTGSHEKINCEA